MSGGELEAASVAEVITVVVADDHDIYRAGIVRSLRADPRFEVLAAASDGEEALEAIRRLAPDVALLDVQMPRLTGVEVALANPTLPVLLLSAFPHDVARSPDRCRLLEKSVSRSAILDALATLALEV